jgi:serine/threonine-protein kinase
VTAKADDPRAEADPIDLRVGAEVGAYSIVRLVGRGGMGAVYEARHTRLGRRFAVKFLLPELAARPEIIRRFENEAVAAGALEHPNLVVVTDLGRAADGAPFIVMEYLDGEDCAHLLHRVGPLPAPRAAELVLQACRGVAVAHAGGTIHRDLKPENLFLTKAGDGGDLIKVLDFGVAKLRPAPDKLGEGKVGVGTRTGATLGTAHYMSPEQARGAGEVDVRADVWALGVVLYELLGGRRPFEGDDFLNVVHQILSVDPPALGTLRPGLPAGLEAVVGRAMSKDPTERYPSVTALAEALQPFAGRAVAPRAVSSPTAATIETTGVGGAPSRRPRWTSARVGTILAMAALTVGAILFIGGRAPATHAPPSPPAAATTTAQATPAAPSVPTAPEAPSPGVEVGGPVRKPDDRPARARPAPTDTGHARSAARGARGLALEPNPY